MTHDKSDKSGLRNPNGPTRTPAAPLIRGACVWPLTATSSPPPRAIPTILFRLAPAFVWREAMFLSVFHSAFRFSYSLCGKSNSSAADFLLLVSGKHYCEGILGRRRQFSADTFSEPSGLCIVEPAKDAMAQQPA